MDVVKNDDDPTLLMEISSRLPCLLIPPEEDSEKIISLIPNDLRMGGQRVSQWGVLGPSTGERYGANVVKAWDIFSGEFYKSIILKFY